MLKTQQDGRAGSTSPTYFRGDAPQFHPTDESLEQPTALADYFLDGWMPAEPFVTPTTPIVAFGSCFADNISRYLHGRGFNVLTRREGSAYVTRMGDGIVNTHALLQQFQWAWQGRVPRAPLWSGYRPEAFGYEESVRLETRRLFDEANVFILTLGLSEVWYDEPTGEVFWRAVPQEHHDPARHKFRVTSVAENLQNLRAIHDLVRAHRPDAALVFTLSPIPLKATFRRIPCVAANSVSKAILRVALDELWRERAPADPRLFYFPSHEIVTTAFDMPYGSDRRHVHPHILDVNMKAFEAWFCVGGVTPAELEAAYEAARSKEFRLMGLRGRDARPEARRQRLAEQAAQREARVAERVAARVAAREAAAKAR